MVRPKFKSLGPLDSCTCMYNDITHIWEVPKSSVLAHMFTLILYMSSQQFFSHARMDLPDFNQY